MKWLTIILLILTGCNSKDSYTYLVQDTVDSVAETKNEYIVFSGNMTRYIPKEYILVENIKGKKLYQLNIKVKDRETYRYVFGEYKDWIPLESNKNINIFIELKQYKLK